MKKPRGKWLLAWSTESHKWATFPLEVALQSMQEAYVKGAKSPAPFLYLAIVNSREEAHETARLLQEGRELRARLTGETIAVTA